MEMECKAKEEMKVESVLSGLGMIDGQQVTLDPPPYFCLPSGFLLTPKNLTCDHRLMWMKAQFWLVNSCSFSQFGRNMTFTKINLFNHHTTDNAASSMANYCINLPLRSKGYSKVKRLVFKSTFIL